MDIDLETKIVKAFFVKNTQPRLLYELTNNRRDEFIHKLCHGFKNYLKNDCILDESTRMPNPSQFFETMNRNCAGKECYVISEYEDLDGVITDLKTAEKRLNCNGFASFIVGLPSGFTHFKAESDRSYMLNFYLKPKVRFDGLLWDK